MVENFLLNTHQFCNKHNMYHTQSTKKYKTISSNDCNSLKSFLLNKKNKNEMF